MRLRNNVAAVAGALLIGSAIALPATAANAAPLPEMTANSFKACEATSGVGTVDPAFPSKPQPVDENVSVYVGGSFTRSQGSELEGQLVVNGDATLVDTGDYSMGFVGGGSGIVPVEGQDLVRVGGDLTLNGASKARVSSVDVDGQRLPGNVKVGGTATPESQILLDGGGTFAEALGRSDALGPVFADWSADDFAVLHDFVTRNQTGTPGSFALAAGGYLELIGTPGADRHLITIPADKLPTGKADLKLVNIDATDITVIQVTGATAKVNLENTYLGDRQLIMWDFEFGQISARTLWTFPDAADVTIAGGQIPGSVVVPSANSQTRLEAVGANGRYWVAGDLSQHRGGSEFQAFPFLGDAASSCGSPAGSTPPVVVPPVTVPPVTVPPVTVPPITVPVDKGDHDQDDHDKGKHDKDDCDKGDKDKPVVKPVDKGDHDKDDHDKGKHDKDDCDKGDKDKPVVKPVPPVVKPVPPVVKPVPVTTPAPVATTKPVVTPKPGVAPKPVVKPTPVVTPAPVDKDDDAVAVVDKRDDTPSGDTAAGGSSVPGSDKGLAATGAEPLPVWILGGGIAAVIAGAALFVIRRRSHEDAQL